MKSIERMNRMLEGKPPDRPPFVPSIYEHGAAVIEKSPGEVSRDPKLMADAALGSYALYKHDLVTVGIDNYNIEVEAFGCMINKPRDSSVPGVISHPLAEDQNLDPERLPIPKANDSNRLALIADASKRVVHEIGEEVWVYACMSGPFSQAVELRSFERLIGDMNQVPATVHKLLEKTTELSIRQAKLLSQQGCGVYLAESWATIPLISPRIFETFVVPYHKRIISSIRSEFSTPPPAAIIGGNTSILIDFFLEAGSSFVVADFNTDFDFIKARTKNQNILVRGCADPKMIEWGDWEQLEKTVHTLAIKARGMMNFVWGCGCVSYNTTKENLLRFKEMCLQEQL